ncbi:hypothetical protein [Desulfopila aestuarii]|uniref:hypothetical protein n=1 Tax=Desulfopila aestuarii TaxID=231440 RepID=UPI0011611F8F|nr:hypothetical protein [Desulfopila aestuarii]
MPVLLEDLKSLEYRGYDTAGIVYLENGKLVKYRSQGKLTNLENLIGDEIPASSHIGLCLSRSLALEILDH